MIQTILGSGGGIGVPLARELLKYTGHIRLVSRDPKKVNETDELLKADLSDPRQVEKSISGSDIVYVTVGFKYNLKVWQETWPPFMQAVIDACIRHNSKLVFFDNVYSYDREAIPFMTETSKINPPGKKGKVRQQIRNMILQKVDEGKLTALIARGADFYGPENKNSALTIMVVNNLLKGKKPQVFGNPDKIHTYTFTPDAAGATALLGNTQDAWNQEWHVPTTKEKLTTRQWIELIEKELNVNAGIQVVSLLMIRILGLIIPVMREFPEMIYQYEQDYIFDSSKFEKRFGITATRPAEGIQKLIRYLKPGQA
jgi:nucleoside-diphosphate-sugar epimerase